MSEQKSDWKHFSATAEKLLDIMVSEYAITIVNRRAAAAMLSLAIKESVDATMEEIKRLMREA